RRLNNLKPELAASEADIVCDDIVRLKAEFYDARDKLWREEWSTLAADGQPDRLPAKIRITLSVFDERHVEVPFQTEVRLPIQEPLNPKMRMDQAMQPAAGSTPPTNGQQNSQNSQNQGGAMQAGFLPTPAAAR